MDTAPILASYTANSGDQYAVAREFGWTPHTVMEVIHKAEHRPVDGLQFIVPVRPRPTDRVLGPPRLQRKILSIRHRDEPGWPVEDRAKIESARRNYDQGFVELAQHRDGPWVIQYIFTRHRRRKPRAPWLTAQVLAPV